MLTATEPAPLRSGTPRPRRRGGAALTVWSLLHLRWIRTQWRSAALVLVGLVLGVGLCGAMLVMYVSTGQPFASLADGLAGAADWQVQPYVTGRLPEDALRDVADTPGVTAAAPIITEFSMLGTSDGDSQGVLVVGTDCRFEDLVGDFDCDARVAELEEAAGAADAIPLLAGPGLSGPLATGSSEPVPVGLSGGLLGDAVVIDRIEGVPELMHVNDGKWVLGAVTDVQTLIDAGPHLSSVLFDGDGAAAGRVRAQLGEVGRIQEPSVPAKVFLEVTRSLILVAAVLVLAGGVLIAGTSYLLMLDDRRRTFAIAGVLGVSPKRMLVHVCGEGAAVGLVAGLMALPIAWLLGSVFTTSWGNSLLAGTGAAVNVEMPLLLAGLVVAGGVLVGIAAALPVALRTARTDAIVTVREDEGVAAIHKAPRWVWAMTPVPMALGLWIGYLWGSGRVGLMVGVSGAGLLMLGMAAFAFFFTPTLTKWVETLCARGRSAGLLAGADMARDPFRWASVTTVIALALIASLGFHVVRTLTVRSMVGHVESEIAGLVYVGPRESGDQSTVYLKQNTAEAVASVDGVAAVHPQYRITVDDGMSGINIAGTDPAFPRKNLTIQSPGISPTAAWQKVAQGEAIVGNTYAAKRGIRPGDTFELPGQNGPFEVRAAAIASAGFFQDNGLSNWIVVSDELAQEKWQAGLDFLMVQPEPTVSPQDLARRIEREVDSVRLGVADLSQTQTQAMENGSRFIGPVERVGWVMLLVSAMAVSIFFALTLMQRGNLRVVLRYIGYTAQLERRTLILEAGVLAGTGFVYGFIGALLVAFLVSLASPALLASTVEWAITPEIVILAAISAVVTVGVGLLYPLWASARLDRGMAMGYSRIEEGV